LSVAPSDVPLQLNERLDRGAIRQAFDSRGRVHIPQFFQTASAIRIATALREETPWQLSLNSGSRHVDLATGDIEALPSAQQVLLVNAINEDAKSRFQYVFNNYPIHDLYRSGRDHDHFLMRVYEYLNAAAFLEFVREVTGFGEIAAADAQATLYRPGHFLTAHDDDVAGKGRLVAYVLNFTSGWSADWGGILQFIDAAGHIAEGYTPTFNSLNLLRVPQQHCVSYVTPAGSAGRYSITGWLRTALD